MRLMSKIHPLLPILAGLLTAATIASATWFISVSEYRRQAQGERLDTLRQMSAVRAQLEGALMLRLLLVKSICSYISIHGDIDHETFQSSAEGLVTGDRMIRNVSLLKNTVIVDVYPMKGNEKALGVDLAKVPGQRQTVEKAIETRQSVVAGPVELVQGGVGIAGRIPIFLTPKGKPFGSGDYWGQASVVIMTDPLFKEVGIIDPFSGLKYALRGKDGLGAEGAIFLGEEAVFRSSPVVLDVILPGGTWQMAAMPAAGWGSQSAWTPWFSPIGYLLSIFAGWLIWSLLVTKRTLHERLSLEHSLMEKFKESEAKHRNLVSRASDGIVVVQDGLIRYFNPALADMSGYDADEMLNVHFSKFIPPQELPLVQERSSRRMAGEDAPRIYQSKLLHKDGHVLEIEFNVGVITFDGKPADLTVVRDITERKRWEQALENTLERFYTILSSSYSGLLLVRNEGVVEFANQAMCDLFDIEDPPASLQGLSAPETIAKLINAYEQPAKILAFIREAVAQNMPIKTEEVAIRGGRTYLVDYIPIVIGGKPYGRLWSHTDITDLRRAEEIQRLLSTAIEQAAESVLITDVEGNILHINPAFERISGYSKNELIGNNPRILKSGEHDDAFYKELWSTLLRGEVWTGRFVNKKKDGSIYHENSTIAPVRDSSGQVVNYVAVKRDVTQELILQKQLLQAQKMEAVGTLAGGISHDFNNLLQAVLGYVELMLNRKKEGERDYADLHRIQQAGQRGSDLVKSLMTFSRKVETKYVPVNLNQEILQVQAILSRTIPKTIKIDLRLSEKLETIQGDPSQINQILMNLGVNARDAMPDGGTLTFETASIQLDREYCNTHFEAKPGHYLLLIVSDTGQGMDKETQAHIFEPFFTTKEAGKGTGLGLATVYGIVKNHDGHIMCYSEPGYGTTFKIYLPAIQTGENSLFPTSEEAIRGGTETILLVDDDEVLCELGTALLNRFGYEVITAGNGKEALEKYEREGERFSLVILDLIMPEMDGKQCLAEILLIDPNVKVLIASGYSVNGQAMVMSDLGAKGFVEKPYNMRQLLTSVRKVLDDN